MTIESHYIPLDLSKEERGQDTLKRMTYLLNMQHKLVRTD